MASTSHNNSTEERRSKLNRSIVSSVGNLSDHNQVEVEQALKQQKSLRKVERQQSFLHTLQGEGKILSNLSPDEKQRLIDDHRKKHYKEVLSQLSLAHDPDELVDGMSDFLMEVGFSTSFLDKEDLKKQGEVP
eukprot:CAMPEP_0170512668 /NCGR_PEP_ID=MMETSP0208-20121228/66978_1 /TAXON_ID=197538 /ORGANISM="Strombidium inclinatum, Strain S3" /LENGTH=132 /DNA_ID=CAMNT_0010796323 /DNA_START=55 /DNA_END=453 /DNA_ORIENTATION=-